MYSSPTPTRPPHTPSPPPERAGSARRCRQILCVCVCVCVCVCGSIYICISIYAYACVCMNDVHLYMHACMHAHTDTYIHTHTHTCMHACMHLSIHRCMCVRIYNHRRVASAPALCMYIMCISTHSYTYINMCVCLHI